MDSDSATQLVDAEREELRRDLEVLADELHAMLAGSTEAARPVELDQPAIGRVSRVDAIQQQKMLQANRSALSARAQRVQSALARLADDEYGECVGCGQEIGYKRLKARPESLYCIGCQTARERP